MQIEKKWMIFFYESMKKARSLSLINVRRGEKVYDSWEHFCCVLFHAKTSRWLNKDDWSQVCWCGLADLVRSRDGHRWRMCRSVCAFMVAPDPTPGVPDGGHGPPDTAPASHNGPQSVKTFSGLRKLLL